MTQSAIDDLATTVGRGLAARGWLLATAESCTGGLVAGAITDVAGSSTWFDRGFITYSNQAKQELLGVTEATLTAHGAVSEAVAAEMVAGALRASPAEVAVSVTGVAGPGGGTATKPVGMVCFAWLRRGSSPVVTTRHFPGDRAAVRKAAVEHALRGVVDLMRTQTNS